MGSPSHNWSPTRKDQKMEEDLKWRVKSFHCSSSSSSGGFTAWVKDCLWADYYLQPVSVCVCMWFSGIWTHVEVSWWSVSAGGHSWGGGGVWASCYCPATGCSTIIYLVVIEDEPWPHLGPEELPAQTKKTLVLLSWLLVSVTGGLAARGHHNARKKL